MAFFIPRKKEFWQRKPENPEINWGHEMAADLVAAVIYTQPTELVSGTDLTVYGAPTKTDDYYSFDGVDDAFSFPVDLSGTGDVSIAAGVVTKATGSNNLLLEYTSNFNGRGGFLLNMNDNGKFSIATRANTYVSATFSAPSLDYHDFMFKFSSTQTGLVAKVDAITQGLTYSNDTADGTNYNNDTLYLNSRAGTSLEAPSDNHYLYVWATGLAADAYAEALTENPYQLLKPRRKFWAVPSAGGATPTIVGNVTATVTPSALLAYTASSAIVGNSAVTLAPLADTAYTIHPSILGSSVASLTPASVTDYIQNLDIVGASTLSLTPAAVTSFTGSYALVGNSVLSLAPGSALYYTQNHSILGDSSISLAPLALTDFQASFALVGSSSITFAPASLMAMGDMASITGNSSVSFSITGATDYTLHGTTLGSSTISLVPGSLLAKSSNESITGVSGISLSITSVSVYSSHANVIGNSTVALVPITTMAYLGRTSVVGDTQVQLIVAAVMAFSAYALPASSQAILDELTAILATMQAGLDKVKYTRQQVYLSTDLLVNGDGTQWSPFNNLPDALDHAELINILDIVLTGNATADRDLDTYVITGLGGPSLLLSGTSIHKTTLAGVTLQGTFTGRPIATRCTLDHNLAGVDGTFMDCMLNGDVTCADGAYVDMYNPRASIGGLGVPRISMGPSGACKLNVRGMIGSLEITDSNDAFDESVIEMITGALTLDVSNTLGTIVPRGSCAYINNAAGSTVDESGLNAQQVWKGIQI